MVKINILLFFWTRCSFKEQLLIYSDCDVVLTHKQYVFMASCAVKLDDANRGHCCWSMLNLVWWCYNTFVFSSIIIIGVTNWNKLGALGDKGELIRVWDRRCRSQQEQICFTCGGIPIDGLLSSSCPLHLLLNNDSDHSQRYTVLNGKRVGGWRNMSAVCLRWCMTTCTGWLFPSECSTSLLWQSIVV